MALKKSDPIARTRKTPLPKAQRHAPPPAPRKYPFYDMDVGDSFFVPGGHRTGTLTTYASRMGRQLDRKFATRKMWGVKRSDGTYDVTEGRRAGAVYGVGVWRTA